MTVRAACAPPRLYCTASQVKYLSVLVARRTYHSEVISGVLFNTAETKGMLITCSVWSQRNQKVSGAAILSWCDYKPANSGVEQATIVKTKKEQKAEGR